MVAQISIPVANVAALITAGFTRLEIWRTDEYENSYYEVTASAVQAATLDSAVASNTFNMGGKTLKFKVNGGTEQIVTFSTLVTNWTPTQVVNRINEVVASLASVSSGAVRLTSPTTGRASSLEITYNDASTLEWTAGQITYGLDARLTLSGGTVIYTYTDVSGSVEDLYKWRFSANGVNPISDLYGPKEAVSTAIASIPLSVATAYFSSLDGRPMKAKIIVVTDSVPLRVGSYAVGSDHPLVVEADDDGFLQLPLAQGAIIRVAIEGTAYVREITVPATDTFDLLSALSTAPDPFTVQVPAPFLSRRTL